VSDDSGEEDPSGSGDELLRAIAAAPDQAPPSGVSGDPERISHFRVLGRLGRGGMGIVYRAEDESLGRVVALKVLPPGVEDDAERRKRLLREARSAATVTHPNIATVYEVGEADGRIFVAMEHVEGETLRARIGRGNLPIALAIEIAAQIARGLVKAHAANIVHRDLKPENVIVTTDGRVKILDFGLAKLVAPEATTPSTLGELETATLDGHILGTPAYMSPEQASSGSIDARSDLFALGVILYEMTTGARPFVGETAASTLAAVLRDKPKAPSARSAKVSVALERAILRCLEKNPEDRFASATELLAALEALDPRAPMRVPRRLTGALLVVVVVSAVIALGLRAGNRPATAAAASAASARASASATASLIKTTLIDRPPPRSSNPEALAAYAAAMHELQNASVGPALVDFERATELDPTLAAAHLRIVVWAQSDIYGSSFGTDSVQTHEAKAALYRASLSESDQAALDCLELHDGKQIADCGLAVSRRYWGDAELVYLSADVDATLLDRAAELDPKLALVPYRKERVAFQAGEPDEVVLRFANECLSLAPRSSNCLFERIRIEFAAGECERAAADTRKLVALLPTYAGAHRRLADVLFARGEDPESVAEVLRMARSLMPAPERAKITLEDAFDIAIWRADFAAAERATEALERLAPESNSARMHRDGSLLRMSNYEEMGESEKALAIAARLERQRAAWVEDDPIQRVDLLAILVRANRAPAGQLEAARAAAIAATTVTPGFLWESVYASSVATPAEARDALAALPRFSAPVGRDFTWEVPKGRTYLLAGRAPEALPFLRRAAHACAELNWSYPEYVRGKELLGEALEATGDQPGACAAYADVIARWGNAKPRSVTAEKARARAAALGCKR
jgi:tetratricopeptide (TPR) repeat protein/predicted Ser/Thr protein kinase